MPFFNLQILTKDSVTVVVDAVIYARIYDATMATVNVKDARGSTYLLGATTLRTMLGTVGLSEILSDRDRIDKEMQVWQFGILIMHNGTSRCTLTSTCKYYISSVTMLLNAYIVSIYKFLTFTYMWRYH